MIASVPIQLRTAITSTPRVAKLQCPMLTWPQKLFVDNFKMFPSRRNIKKAAQLGSVAATCCAAQSYLGATDDFFDYRFVTSKHPDDLMDFFGGDDLMEIFCVMPFVVKIMMRGGTFDERGHFHTWGLLGGPRGLEVSIDFDERGEETIMGNDGAPDTIVSWFNKREKFRDVAPVFFGGFTVWEMTQNFGYKRLEDGQCEVYHHGERFHGLFPLRLLFQIHAKYVFWAIQFYINGDAFGSEELVEEAELQRRSIPLHAFRHCLGEAGRWRPRWQQ